MRSTSSTMVNKPWTVPVSLAVAVVVTGFALCDGVMAQTKKTRYSSAKDWDLQAKFLSPRGVNPWHQPLTPGHRYITEKANTPDGFFHKEVSVTDETEEFDIPGIGQFKCAVVVEEEFFDGVYYQHTAKWYCIDTRNKNVYTFGELSWEIDSEGERIFDATWRAGEPDGNGVAEAGLLMPGTPLVGARYIHAGHESEAFGGSEIMETGISLTTPAGTFENCVRVREYGITNPDEISDKIWCKGVGLLSDAAEGQLVASSGVSATLDKLEAEFGKHHRPGQQKFREEIDPEEAVITADQAKTIALKVVQGEVTSVTLEKKRGVPCFVVELRNRAGGEIDVFVDISNGKVIGTDE